MRVNYSKAKDLFGFKYAFYKHTRLSVLEKIKNKKKISENNFILRPNFSEKIFLQKSRNDSVAAGAQIGGVYLQRTRRHNIGTLRTYRTYIVSVFP